MSGPLATPAAPRTRGRAGLLLAGAICAALALAWTVPLSAGTSWGWDETMHVELPALRILFALQEGEPRAAADAVLECERYPFVYPLVLAVAQGVCGPSEHLCRVIGTLVWCLTLFGLHLLAVEVRRGFVARGEVRGVSAMPWLVLLLGATSPLALGFAGTLFLEVPFACAATFSLWSWLRRGPSLPEGASPGTRWRRDVAAGAWLAVALFTKFNYGLLLGAALSADWVAQTVRRVRDDELGPHLRSLLRLAAVPVVVLAWWFLLPLPAGAETAASHRAAIADFLAGNRGFAPTPWDERLIYFFASFAPTVRAGVVLLVGVLLSVFACGRGEVRPIWLAALALGGSVALHPFHQDRFLIPVGVPLWTLAALGWAAALPTSPARAAAVALGLVALCGLGPGFDAPHLARRLGVLREEPVVRAYQLGLFDQWRDLSGGRTLRSAGLAAGDQRELSALVTGAVGAEERVGWIGISSEYSPAALHFALWEAGGPRRRFLEAAHRPNYVTFTDEDPGWERAELEAFAARHDVVLATDPPDLKGRSGRAFLRGYQERLITELGWNASRLGVLSVTRALQEPLEVSVYALRP